MNKTEIQWCDFTSNPVKPELLGHAEKKRHGWFCTKVSAGCAHCYAERMNQRCTEAGAGIGNGLAFTAANEAKVRFTLDERELQKILRCKAATGSRVFVGDMTDLWHRLIPWEFLDALWAVMALRPDLTFMLLTKRACCMQEYILSRAAVDASNRVDFSPQWYQVITHWLDEGAGGFLGGGAAWDRCHDAAAQLDLFQPLPNVQLGVSVEDQATADERIPLLLETPAAVRFISYEPALGPIQLDVLRTGDFDSTNALTGERSYAGRGGQGGHVSQQYPRGLDGVIAGGESGPGARPAHPDWFRHIRDACAVSGVPFFFKQWGEWQPFPGNKEIPPGPGHTPVCLVKADGRVIRPYGPIDSPGHQMVRAGKKAAGRLLDGQLHNDLPGGGK